MGQVLLVLIQVALELTALTCICLFLGRLCHVNGLSCDVKREGTFARAFTFSLIFNFLQQLLGHFNVALQVTFRK